MTGKTHMAISAAAIAVLLAATEAAAKTSPMPCLLPTEAVTPKPNAYAVACLLLLGVVAGLFPDLDAPDTELQHLPGRAARHAGRFIKAGMPTRSLLGTMAQALVALAALPFSLMLVGISTAFRTFTGHRGFTHTLWGALTFTGLAVAATLLTSGSWHSSLTVGTVWLVGYTSHLAADACTPSGIPLFGNSGSSSYGGTRTHEFTSQTSSKPTHTRAPGYRASRARSFHLLPERMLIRTGSPADTLLVRLVSWVVFLAAAVPLFIQQ